MPELEHWHWCGDPIDRDTVGKGCGHVWQHPTILYDTKIELNCAHLCPRCGAGPWTYKRHKDELPCPPTRKSSTSRPGG